VDRPPGRLGRCGRVAASDGRQPAAPGHAARRPQGVARTIADSGSWLPVHQAIVGLILLLGGLVAIAAFAPATEARGAMFSARRRLRMTGEKLAPSALSEGELYG
jgi:hypothetical protein